MTASSRRSNRYSLFTRTEGCFENNKFRLNLSELRRSSFDTGDCLYSSCKRNVTLRRRLKKWRGATPDDFVFSVKGGRFITHIKRLANIRTPLANFLASGLLRLGPKLGPILWQLPPNFRFDENKLDNFLRILPRDTEEAVAIARRHDARLKNRAWMRTDAKRPMRHALEVRHDSFRSRGFVEMLRAYGVALVCADAVEWPRLMDVTADFVYCRLHGSQELYASGYDDAALEIWARRAAEWVRGREPGDAETVINQEAPKLQRRDVYIYFDNDKKVRAPFDAMKLERRVKELLAGNE